MIDSQKKAVSNFKIKSTGQGFNNSVPRVA